MNLGEKEKQSLNGFVKFINSKSGITRKKTGSGKGNLLNPTQLLFEISTTALVVGFKPNVICSLQGYRLTVGENTKNLSLDQMDNLYEFVEQKNSIGAFSYVGSYFDLTLNDGNSHSYFINWNGIKSEGGGGHTMPSGLTELFEYCINLVNS